MVMPNELNTRSAEIAAEIRGEMAKQKFPITALAEQVGMPVSTLRRSVLGYRSFTVDELFSITTVLGIRMSDLIEQAA